MSTDYPIFLTETVEIIIIPKMSTNEYRCTRNQPYLNPKCFGHTDLEARQGFYVKVESEQDAKAVMEKLYPDDNAGFTAQIVSTFT